MSSHTFHDVSKRPRRTPSIFSASAALESLSMSILSRATVSTWADTDSSLPYRKAKRSRYEGGRGGSGGSVGGSGVDAGTERSALASLRTVSMSLAT